MEKDGSEPHAERTVIGGIVVDLRKHRSGRLSLLLRKSRIGPGGLPRCHFGKGSLVRVWSVRGILREVPRHLTSAMVVMSGPGSVPGPPLAPGACVRILSPERRGFRSVRPKIRILKRRDRPPTIDRGLVQILGQVLTRTLPGRGKNKRVAEIPGRNRDHEREILDCSFPLKRGEEARGIG